MEQQLRYCTFLLVYGKDVVNVSERMKTMIANSHVSRFILC